MKIIRRNNQKGNGIVVVISVVATILAILGAAVSYTGHVSRISQRGRRTALAMEIADGHLEYLFTNWRNIYRKTWITYGVQSGGTDYSTVGTNWFYTALYNPGNGCSGCPAPTPIPSPYASPTPFPTPALSPNTPLTTLKGVPVWNVTRPDVCQPPRMVCSNPCFVKKGRSYT